MAIVKTGWREMVGMDLCACTHTHSHVNAQVDSLP